MNTHNKSRKDKKEIEPVKYIKIPDWIYWGSDRVTLQYKNPEGEYMKSEFYPMDYEEIVTEQVKQVNEQLIEKTLEIEVLHKHYQQEINRLREEYPYRGKAVVNVTKDGTKYRVQIIEAFDTRDGIWIEGKI